MTTSIKGMESMLVGFRFHPIDEELVSHYLRLKMEGNDSLVRVIPEVNVCKWELCDLPKFSVIKSDDPEWFFFSPRDFKNSNSNRTNRATKSGYWKVTSKDRKIKARGTNNVIEGLCPLSLKKKKTDEKTNVTARDEGEESSYIASDFENPMREDTIPEVHDQTEEDLESALQLLHQLQDYDASSSQLPLYNQQEPSFVDSTFTNGCNGLQFQSDDNEHEEDQRKFVDSLFVDQDEHPHEEILHLSHTDADTAQAKVEVNIYSPTAIGESPIASKLTKMLQGTMLLLIFPRKKNVTESNKEQKMAKGTNAKEILKSTRDGSAGSDRKGYLNFQETSLLVHESSPPWAYFVNILIGVLLFVVVIWGVVICGNYWC
ncbi:NAC domain-containing protein 4-like [Quercus robur]|uniref:NAC domain-containing protein 4-like n=1 Tax=Quercus robur TaxID=38942 RepID=UPI0021638BEB|nr:NAC domain-containing protein 4-like [Quercus robur]